METARIKYRYAVIGFSPDLTDPKRRAVPVAVVGSGIGEAGANGFLFVLANPDPGIAVDPIAKDILAGMPRFLREHMEAGVTKFGGDVWMSTLSQQLNQSLHVTKVDETTVEMPVSDFEKMVMSVLQRFQGELTLRTFGTRRAVPTMPTFTLEPVSALLGQPA
jgi:hypothetical protein